MSESRASIKFTTLKYWESPEEMVNRGFTISSISELHSAQLAAQSGLSAKWQLTELR